MIATGIEFMYRGIHGFRGYLIATRCPFQLRSTPAKQSHLSGYKTNLKTNKQRTEIKIKQESIILFQTLFEEKKMLTCSFRLPPSHMQIYRANISFSERPAVVLGKARCKLLLWGHCSVIAYTLLESALRVYHTPTLDSFA